MTQNAWAQSTHSGQGRRGRGTETGGVAGGRAPEHKRTERTAWPSTERKKRQRNMMREMAAWLVTQGNVNSHIHIF